MIEIDSLKDKFFKINWCAEYKVKLKENNETVWNDTVRSLCYEDCIDCDYKRCIKNQQLSR